MKLETSTPLRRDGTVIVTGLNGQKYIFKPEVETGLVVCDVDHEATVAHLLKFGDYFPADEADHDMAEQLITNLNTNSGGPDGDPDDEDGELDDDEADPNALPVEAGTPPASIPKVNKPPRAAKPKSN